MAKFKTKKNINLTKRIKVKDIFGKLEKTKMKSIEKILKEIDKDIDSE